MWDVREINVKADSEVLAKNRKNRIAIYRVEKDGGEY